MLRIPAAAASIAILSAFAPGQDQGPANETTALVREHCATCHGGDQPKARLDLLSFTLAKADPELVAKLLEPVRSGDMPPPDEVTLDDEVRANLIAGLDAALVALVPDPGRPTLRRLNRHEYGEAVRDLLGIDLDVERDLPEDASSEGFDNQGDVLFLTPMLADLYLDATGRAIAEFVATGGAERVGLVRLTEEHDVRSALTEFLERAFRRPPLQREIESRAALLAGDEGIRACVASILLSPHFLFRVEEDREQAEPWRISAWELATRLSFLIWAAPPDGELRDAARDGSLLDEAGLFGQVERLLDDARSSALATRFAGRWLGFADLPTQAVDVRRFRGTHDRLKRSMHQESVLFFDGLVRENRSLLELVDSGSTFLDGTLAKHYGVDGVKGNEMRRVELTDRRRGGVLTQASVLTLTSQPLRTSPVVRGAWILDRLFGAPSPPPPPDAGSLPADDQLDDGLTLRQRLEQHRADAACAGCHARMDPLGFALENYDGVGRWRDEDHIGVIDAHAVLPDGREVDGIVGLKDALLDEPERIARGTSKALLIYALGRPLEPADEPVLARLVHDLRESDWRARALVHGVTRSYPFQHKRRAR